MGKSPERSPQVLFNETLKKVKFNLKIPQPIDIVIGIPFYNETRTINDVISIVQESFKAEKNHSLIVCVGDPAGKETLEVIKEHFGESVVSFLMPEGVNGRGYSIRAIFELARHFESDIILLEADLESVDGQGIKPSWIDRLSVPILDNYDMSVASFRRHPFEDIIGNILVAPLISALYGTRFKDPLSGVFAISHQLVEEFCMEFDLSSEHPGGYGINPWLITTGLKWKKKICEVNLGAKLSPISFGKKHIVLKEMLKTLFQCIKRDEDFWTEDFSAVKNPDVIGWESRDLPLDIICNEVDFIEAFQEGYYQYLSLLQKTLSKDVLNWLEDMAEADEVIFSLEKWSKITYEFLLSYTFNEDMVSEDILEMFLTIYDGLVAGFLKELKDLKKALVDTEIDVDSVLSAKASDLYRDSVNLFFQGKSSFIGTWKKRVDETRPVLTPLGYLEFIPGVPIVLPNTLKGLGNREVKVNKIFQRLQNEYEEAFKAFLQTLDIDVNNDSSDKIGKRIHEFMIELENTGDKLFPGNLYTEEGTMQVISRLFEMFPHEKVYAVKGEVLRKLLYEYPPNNLILRLGFRNLRELLDHVDIRDALTLAQFSEDKDYFDRIFYWLQDNLRPDSFEEAELLPLIVSRNNFHGTGELREISDLNRLTARIPVMNLGKGMGGDYPKLRYFTRIAKSIVEAEHFSYLWKTFARERKEVGRKFVNSILGHYGKALFSAHHIFENWHNRVLVSKLETLARTLEQQNKNSEAKNIKIMAEGYGLSLVLEDGAFIPCSAWTWASFSFKGGDGIPTPLFLRIERDWFNHDLLEEIYREMGYNSEEILLQVFQYISQGRESIDLADALLGVKPPREEVIIQELDYWPKAEKLKRYSLSSILAPIKDNWWENRFVLNTAAFRLKDKVYLLYRAFGEDEVSRIGLAISDGYQIIERLKEPVFSPEIQEEKKGCEDPRTVIIGDEIFMLYTAYDGVVAQIAAASISVQDFLNRRFDRWIRRGLAFPGLWDKDALLFPEKIDGNYVIYHRIEPSIWTAYSDRLVFPWPKEGHKIIMGPRSGRMWDSLKIGAGAQPIKTRYGWLLIYHGVDQEMTYRLGVMVADLKDPGRLLYRSPNPILSPETECEIGKEDECWVPNVVFTCGAVPATEKEILDENDEILVYYGAADTNICLATGTVGQLIPAEVRKRIDNKVRTP